MEYFCCFILAVLSGIPLIILYFHNEDSKKVERFFYHHNQQMYSLLQIATFVLSVTFLFNTRFLASEIFKYITSEWNKLNITKH
jgi:hypothetical protein